MITTEFGFSSTAAEVAESVDLTGKRVIVTGASSGIGVETARALAGRGAEVTLAVRNTDAGEKTAQDIGGDVRVAKLDLTDLASVDAFVRAWDGPLHVLVANAGVMAVPERYTGQGWEWQFATNHLGHFALATGLRPALKAAGDARIVVVSSTGHMLSPVVFDDVNYAFRTYDAWTAYGQSKTANVLFAVEATRRWAGDGITANALMPGAIFTNLSAHLGIKESDVDLNTIKTPEQGAATSVLLATSPLLNGIGGRYFDDCNEAQTVDGRGEAPPLHGVARYALDPDNADRLWTYSETLLAKA
ncbi:SDR family NAD(P)-dependent oxidoreductase [Lentzea sp. BCCO 10_0061]|uniref:SDR family NAD(P)-dependent oxidoreductase n=1 Tax=Lentzea sokolovensis TaxID=3095429 RepID=A0ABU4V819_9PSEU|nr:SDR family NAD(P)-dependent oxidoreductase [Lentzea sp. BCCO 10_0061]MDX8147005.1 SDR family NAD(P)-dependent oxidoreductase [Lentzea sp. BCCO 10_0061]